MNSGPFLSVSISQWHADEIGPLGVQLSDLRRAGRAVDDWSTAATLVTLDMMVSRL